MHVPRFVVGKTAVWLWWTNRMCFGPPPPPHLPLDWVSLLAPPGSLSMGLKAWVAEGGLLGDDPTSLTPPPWSLPLLRNWKIHK